MLSIHFVCPAYSNSQAFQPPHLTFHRRNIVNSAMDVIAWLFRTQGLIIVGANGSRPGPATLQTAGWRGGGAATGLCRTEVRRKS